MSAASAGDEPVAFVAGATGYTGREVVAELRRRGLRTIAHVRPDSPRLRAWRARFEELGAEVDTTPWEADALAATFARVRPTLVFCCLGTTRARGAAARAAGRPVESYDTVDYGLTALLIGAVRAARLDLARFVYVSAAGTSARAASPYGRARFRAEQVVRESGLPHLVAQPSFITGRDRDEDRPAERWAARATDALLAVAAAFGARRLADGYRSTSGAELGRALVRWALDPAGVGRTVTSEQLRDRAP